MLKKIIYTIISLIMIFLSSFSVYKINNLDIIPNKYIIYIIIGLIILNIIAAILLFIKNKPLKIISILIYIAIIFFSFSSLKYTKEIDDFLDNAFNNAEHEITTYQVLVLSNSKFNKVEDLSKKKLGYLSFDPYNKESLVILSNVVITNNKEYNDVLDLYVDLTKKKVEGIIIDSNYIDTIAEEYSDIYEKTKCLYTFDVDKTNEKTTENITTKPNEMSNENETSKIPRVKTNDRYFNIFLSGSDSRSTTIANKSRSDVNMIMTINRDTKTILLTSIPRDYYVQVHGQTGLKDKLTHAGIYGMDSSRQTVEDIFNIEIDYVIKVNFNSVVKVVDLVGGIDIYSDKEFGNFKLGMNHINGKEALAFARERHAYTGGDRHRVLNQQQVLEATIKKAMTNKKILTDTAEILNSLSELYRTNIPREFITTMTKEQLNTLTNWNFETQSVDGSNASRPTYTAPNSKRYVMIPYQDDLVKATNKINDTLNKR